MAIDSVNAVFIGNAKDEHGFRCQVLEEPHTGRRFLAYEPETWWERNRFLEFMNARTKRTPKDNTPRNAWPGRPKR